MVLEELKYNLEWFATWLIGKGGIKTMAYAVAGYFSQSSALASIAGAGVSTGVSAYLAHVDHYYEELRLLNQYRPEIAAKTHKHSKDLTLSDLRNVACGDEEKGIEGNPVLEEALKASDKRRLVKIAVAAIIGVTVFSGIALLGLGGLAAAATGVAVGFAGGQILSYIGERIAGLDKPIANDHVRALQQFQKLGPVQPEQLMDIFVAINPTLQRQAQAAFGGGYEALNPAQRRQFFNQFGQGLQLEELAADINHRQIRLEELAFIAAGQHSGVERLPEPVQTVSERAHQAAQHARERLGSAWGQGRTVLSDKLSTASGALHGAASSVYQRLAAGTPEEQARLGAPERDTSWQERVGDAKPRETVIPKTAGGFVQQLSQEQGLQMDGAAR